MWKYEQISSTYFLTLLNKLAKLFNHLSHKDDVHLVREVGSINCEQASGSGHHIALI